MQADTLRPTSLATYVGQPEVTSALATAIGAARSGGWALDHVLVSGPPGLGKTSLAAVIAAEIGGRLVSASAPALDHKGEVAALLASLAERDVLFIDEIHAMRTKLQEVLYPAMEDGFVDMPVGKGGSKVIRLSLPRFTLVAATTRVGLLAAPLVERFGLHFQMRYYDEADIAAIVARSAALIGIAIDHDGILEIARRSRGTPRTANRLLRRARDHAVIVAERGGLVPSGTAPRNAVAIVNGPLAREALDRIGLDRAGLEPLQISYLAALATRSPLGVDALATLLATERGTLETTVEPFLLQAGLIARTPRGRIATDSGIALIQGDQ